jgi:hypothetical protein
MIWILIFLSLHRWLRCPITGKHWLDRYTILGVGLHHAPRFLSEDEKKRQSESSKAANKRKDEEEREKMDHLARSGTLFESTELADSWMKGHFQVYAKVDPPPKGQLRELPRLPDDVRVGHLDVIVGPVFDIVAHNDGVDGNQAKNILSAEERGSLDYDQQYNALNFVYQVDKGDGTFERKPCTNRLSFYIDERHGSRIFPENVQSQLSLLLYRTASRFKDPATGETNQRLLAQAIKKVIPKVLKAIVREILSDRAVLASEARFEQAMRLYFLIHQISIKLVLRYQEAYQFLYRSVMRWIFNPFTEDSIRAFPDIEEVLIAASLVGIPWNLIREAFMRRLIASLMMNAGVMSSTSQMHDRIRHCFHQNKQTIHRILYEFSFFVATGQSLFELDRKYARCAGTLPKAERQHMKESALAVKDIDSFEKFWIAMGMDVVTSDDVDVKRHIAKYFEYLAKTVPLWQKMEIPASAFDKIRAPELKGGDTSVASLGILRFRSEKDKKLAEHAAEERKKHQGLPRLNARGALDRDVCNFPECGRKFSCRTHLMMHIKRIFRRELKFGYHKKHQSHSVSDPQALECAVCGEVFDTVEEIHRHYAMLNVQGYWFGSGHNKKLWGEEAAGASSSSDEPAAGVPQADPFDEPGLCVICMELERELVFSPCGHLACCGECGGYLKLCPICRTPVDDVLQVHFAVSNNLKIFAP